MNALGTMRRGNLLFLKDYYYIRDEKLPLFDYMVLRSVNGLLHGGIGYLHSQRPNVFHGKFKSTSVLLTASYDPLVSDYGPNRIQAPPKDALKAADPQKDDVYSFGVLLMELLTGKMSCEADFAYLFNSTTERRWDVDDFDPELGNYQNFQDKLMGLLQVAMACASNPSQRRPAMSVVQRMIEDRLSQPQHNKIIEANDDLSKRTRGAILVCQDS